MTDVNTEERVVDLNKARAARYEKLGEGPKIVIGKATLQCPPEVPFKVLDAFGEMEKAQAADDGYGSSQAVMNAVRGLVGDKQFDEYMAEDPSTDDMVALIEGVFQLYGVDTGESSASTES